MADDQSLIVVGKLGRARGLRGEMYVTPSTDFPDRFVGLKEIFVEQSGSWQKQTVLSAHMIGKRPVIHLLQIDSPEAARRWTNRLLAVPKDQAVPLPEDEYYVFDLVGCRVLDESGELVGELEEVLKMPANDVYVVRTPEGGELMCPAVKQFVKSVDLKERKIVVVASGLLSAE